MALNPLRDVLSRAGARASGQDTPFKAEAEAALSGFRAIRSDLERQVHRGDLTAKVAREQAADAAAQLRASLTARSEGYSPVPRALLDRLIEASHARTRQRESTSIEGLQRETNRLLRQTLIEQQVVTRAAEFEGRTFVRSMTGGPPAPTLDSLLGFHESASLAGDDAAQEWARRQLEGFRARVASPDDRRRIDRACDRPDQVNPRIVETYVEALRDQDPAGLEMFADQAIAGRDANACVAAFLLARESPEGTAPRWVRSVLNGLGEFPDVALSTLRACEADARQAEAEAARGQAEFAAVLAESEARLQGVEAPTDGQVQQQRRYQSRPAAQPGEPIGLTLERRGLTPEEFDALVASSDE